MYKGALRTGGGGGVTVGLVRPPKPPCWRDFVCAEPGLKDAFSHWPSVAQQPVLRTVADMTGGGGGGGGVDATENFPSPLCRPSSSQPDALGSGGSKTARPARRVRARIHRTRSEHVIDVEDLPEGEELAVNLADTGPRQLRKHAGPHGTELDERVYAEENKRRCQNWLASIEAAEPLDDIGYRDNGRDGGEVVGLDGVDVEVPEEPFSWTAGDDDDDGERAGSVKVALDRTSSVSTGISDGSASSSASSDMDRLLQRVVTAVGLPADDDDEISIQAPPLIRMRGLVSGPHRQDDSEGGGGAKDGGLRVTSSGVDIIRHRLSPTQHFLSLSQQSSLE